MDTPDSQLLLHEVFAKQARITPRQVALRENKQSITFSELDERVTHLARALQSRGIGAGSMVGLHLERSIDWVASTLAVLKSNAAVVPLPPGYPDERKREILDYAELDMVLDRDESRLASSLDQNCLSLSELFSQAATAGEIAAGNPDQAAFVLCSSGSTGRPKMIVRSHRSFFHRLNWTWNQHPYQSGEVCCQKAHATTTHGIYELFEPLLRGVPVILIADDVVRNLESFWETIKDNKITRLLIVPSALQASLDMPGFEAPQLNVLVLMGEYVHPTLAERTTATFPASTHIYSIYGSTESSSTLLCDLRKSAPGEELPLGKPIAESVRAVVLGPELLPLETGETGRLYMAGSALFTEYFKDKALTEAAFVNAPGNGERLFDTHDQVRLLPDGTLQFVGRTDDTVKVRGFRVDLKEVERTLMGHEGVRQCAVLASQAETGNTYLLAFFAPANLDRAAVFATLKSRLPDYMVPSVLVGVDEFPYTASGKLDRMKLLEEQNRRQAARAPSRKLSTTEQTVWDLWAQTLGHGSFELDSSFFEVGGTSLTVFALVHRLRKAFALDREQLSEQIVYRYPSLEALAQSIDDLRSGRPLQAAQATPLLVTLAKGDAADEAPFFVIASAGGTLGAYEKLAQKLVTKRDVVGVRDPFIWGERDPTSGFQKWVTLYVDAIRQRQPHGPYYLCAYSSAGAFGYEIAYKLQKAGEPVALLALIDTLGLFRSRLWHYGWWVMEARYLRSPMRALVRAAGKLRRPALAALMAALRSKKDNDFALSESEVRKLNREATHNKSHIASMANLLELNTGLPFTLDDAALSNAAPDGYLAVLQDKFKSLMPDVDPASIERIVKQYNLQVKAQQRYKLRTYRGDVHLFEPVTPYTDLLESLFRPYASQLQSHALQIGEPSDRIREITRQFGSLEAHYRSMRDEVFVNNLASKLGPLLE